MRDIKFRAWINDSKKMIYWPEILKNPYLLQSVIGQEQWMTCPPSPMYQLMQYTGLKDKNGVEIYEGDIVSSNDYSAGAWFGCEQPKTKYVVKYIELLGKFNFRVTDVSCNRRKEKTMEVIGNIHQNSELLEVE